MRRWLFVHVRLLARVVVLIVSGLAVSAVWVFRESFSRSSKRIDTWFEALGLGTSAWVAQVVFGLFLLPLLLFLVFKLLPRLLVWFCRRLLPVNRNLEPAVVEKLGAYHQRIWAEIVQRLDMDIQVSIKDRTTRMPKAFIPLEAEEIPTQYNRGRSRRIKSILSFLDTEFFLTPDSRVPLMMVEGEPGAGKSTVFFELFRQLRLRFERNRFGWIPLVIFADKLTEEMLLRPDKDGAASFEGFLDNCHKANHPGAKEFREMRELDRNARLAIIMDGLDEFSDTSRYTHFAANLNSILEKASDQHRIVISCRKEDNEGLVRGRLVRVKALTEKQIILQLKRAARKTDEESPEHRALEGLRRSRSQRLLRNYVSNPYLLKLIVRFYRGQTSSDLAHALDRVFEDVLVRELLKRDEGQGPDRSRDEVAAKRMASFLKDLLGPYCYEKWLPRLSDAGGDQESRRMADHLRKNTELADLLFGTSGKPGYLRLKYDPKSSGETDTISSCFGTRWPREQFTSLVNWIETNRSLFSDYQAFESGAIKHLYELAIDLLKSKGLASGEGKHIHRMRHRRMQHYFMAAHVDRVGLAACPEFRELLANSWLREPLRILAAVGTKPEETLIEFAGRYDKATLMADCPALSAIANRCNILGNAAAFVAYLPAQQDPDRKGALMTGERIEALFELLSSFGLRVQTLYHTLYTSEVMAETSSINSGLVMCRNACLKALADIYASEFLCSDYLKSRVAGLFGGRETRADAEKNSWRVLHRWHIRQSAYFQRLAYRSFYRIRSRHPHFPVGALAVFLYAWDGALFSPSEYRTVIRDTHAGWGACLPTAMARWCVNLTSAGLAMAPFAILWRTFGASTLGLALMTLLGIIMVGTAYAIQARHLLDKGDAYKILPWLSSRLFKALLARWGGRKEYAIEWVRRSNAVGGTLDVGRNAPILASPKASQGDRGNVQGSEASARSQRIAFMLSETAPTRLIESLTLEAPSSVADVQEHRRRTRQRAKVVFAAFVLLAAGSAAWGLGPSVRVAIAEWDIGSDVDDAKRAAKEAGAEWRAAGMRAEGNAFAELQKKCESARDKINVVVERVNKVGPTSASKREARLADLKNAMAKLPAQEELKTRQDQLKSRAQIATFKTEAEDVVSRAKTLLKAQPFTLEVPLRENHARERSLATDIRNLLSEGRRWNGISLGNGETSNLNEELARLGEVEGRLDERLRASAQRLAEIDGASRVSAYLAGSVPLKEKAAAMVGEPLTGLDRIGLLGRSEALGKLVQELEASITHADSILGQTAAREGWSDIQARIADLRMSQNSLEGLQSRIAVRLEQIKSEDEMLAFEGEWNQLQREFRKTRGLQKASVQERVQAFEGLLDRIESAQGRLAKAGRSEEKRLGTLMQMQGDARHTLAVLKRESDRSSLLERAAHLIDVAKTPPRQDDKQPLADASARTETLLGDLRSVESGLRSLQDAKAAQLAMAVAESQRIVGEQAAKLKAALQTHREQTVQSGQRQSYATSCRAFCENESLSKLRREAVDGTALQKQRLERLRSFQREYSGNVDTASLGALWRYSRLADPVQEDVIESAGFLAAGPSLVSELKAFHKQAEGLLKDPLSDRVEPAKTLKLLSEELAKEIGALDHLYAELETVPREDLARNARAIKELVRQKILGWLVALACAFAVFYTVYKIRTRWGDKRGMEEVEAIGKDPTKLIEFLKDNPYSRNVTNAALRALDLCLPKMGPELAGAQTLVAGLFDVLQKRFGEIDTQDTRRLHQMLEENSTNLGHNVLDKGSEASTREEPRAQV